jgi:hypothetical protein
MKFRGYLVQISFLWVDGMAIFPFIFSRRKTPGSIFLNHECIHLRQQLEMGLVLFYICYLVEYLMGLIRFVDHRKAYLNISFEREAYRNEADMKYLRDRRVWAFVKYI